MKQIIKVKVLTEGCLPTLNPKGDWIDLRSAVNVQLTGPYALSRSKKGNDYTRKVVLPTAMIPLGVAMELPKGMEADVVPRSSSNKNYNILQANSVGVIDYSYKGDKDQWHMPIMATGDVDIKKWDRICQFRLMPSQKATFWQKLKWLLSDGIEIRIVESLGNPNRGGLGHSGKQ